MKRKRAVGLALVSVALILAILACGGGTSSPQATSAPAKPSATARGGKATATIQEATLEPTIEEATLEPTIEEATAEPSATPRLIKPTPTKKASAKATPTEASGGVTTVDCSSVPDGELGVAYDRGYVDNSGKWRVVGLVCNHSADAVSNINLTVEIFDKNNKSIHVEENVLTGIDGVDAGEVTPFGVTIETDLPAADHNQVTIASNDTLTLQRATVDTQNVSMVVDDDGDIHILGELINNGSEPVHITGIAAATFTADGTMESADYYNVLIHYLDPGKSGPFRISMLGPKDGATATDYKLYLDAETTTAEDFLISAKDDLSPLSEFVDAYGDFHMAGERTNSDTSNLGGVRLLATLYDKDGNVLDTAMTTLPNVIKAGQVFPYEFDHWGPISYKKGVYDTYSKWRIQVDPSRTKPNSAKLADLSKSAKNTSATYDKYAGTFVGSVVNNSGGALDTITVTVGLWGKTGTADASKLLATGYAVADNTSSVANGKSTTYTVVVPVPKDFDKTQYDVRVLAYGQKP